MTFLSTFWITVSRKDYIFLEDMIIFYQIDILNLEKLNLSIPSMQYL